MISNHFVDDCLAAVPENKIQDILNSFNSYHPKLKFTLETEKNNEINFLDLTLIRNNNNEIKTKWYTKSTWSGRYLNFNSHHPKNQRNSVVIGLTDRAIALTSPEFRQWALNKVRDTLKNNNYPLEQINRIIKQRTFKFYNNSRNSPKSTIGNKHIAMPYTQELSEKLKYILSKHNITICHKAQLATKN